MRFKSNMVASFMGTDLSDEKIDSLSDSPDSESSAVVMAPFRLAYTFASTCSEVFLGTELTDLIRFDLSQQLGVKQEIGRFGILQAGFLFNGVPAKVWRDPYALNQNRDETPRKSNGGRLVWDRIFGIPLQVQYTYRNIDIGSEKSGQSLPLLTSSERDDLDRDGDRHIGEILYRFHLAKKESEKTRGARPLVSGPHLLSSMEDTSVARWSERALQRIRPPVQKHFLNFQKE
jgi:hypothetical protein